MGASVFFGCSFIAFGPALALCLLTIAGDPLRVIILVAGAFFWLVSLLLASLVWFISVHLSNQEDKWLQHVLLMFGAAVSVLLQEGFRFAHFKLLKKADEGLVTISEDGRSPISIKQMAYVSGLSFGIISGVFSVINILADSVGPGTVGIYGDSPYYFITSAFLTMALVFLHTFWGIIFFDACEKRRYWKLALVVVSHLAISGLAGRKRTATLWCILSCSSPWRTEPPACATPEPDAHPRAILRTTGRGSSSGTRGSRADQMARALAWHKGGRRRDSLAQTVAWSTGKLILCLGLWLGTLSFLLSSNS